MESVDTGIKGVPMDVLRAINSEPISDAGPDLAISKYDQNTTVIKGTAFDSDGEYAHLDDMKLTILSSAELLTEVNNDPLLSELNGVRDELTNALTELNKTPPDIIAAVGKIEGAVNKLQDAIKNEMLDPAEGKNFMDQLSSAAWQLAVDAINLAIFQGGDPAENRYAQDFRAEVRFAISPNRKPQYSAKADWQ